MIYVIGAGAIGKGLAVLLQKHKRKVTLVRGRIDDLIPQKRTITVDTGKILITEDIPICGLSNISPENGILVITSKAHGNLQLSLKLSDKAASLPIVLLQNGISNEEPFLNAGFKNIFRCILFTSSQIVQEDHISLRSVAPSPVGTIISLNHELSKVVETLDLPEFHFAISNEIQPVIWEKVIINAAYNSICPLVNADNGVFKRDDNMLALAKSIILEGTQLASAFEVNLDREKIEKKLLMMSELSDGQLISTLQDLNAARETEIDQMNLALAKMAYDKGMQVPLIESLGKLVKYLSEKSQD